MNIIKSVFKRSVVLYLLLFSTFELSAQRSKDAVLEDSVFVWKPMAALVPSKYPWTISPAQQKLPTLFFDWIKKSHQLVGAVNKSYALAEPNKKDEVSAYTVGVNAAVWKAEWDNGGKIVKNQPHSEVPIQVLTNYLIDATPIRMLSIPGRPVFTRPSQNLNEVFKYWNYGNNLIKQFQLEKNSQIGKYIIQYYGCTGEMCQPMVAIYLAPNNKLPIRQLTRGEVLNMCEEAIPGEIKRLAGDPVTVNNSYLKKRYDDNLNRIQTEEVPKWKNQLTNLRKKYSNSLDSPAFLKDPVGFYMIKFSNGDDIFSDKEHSAVYVYEQGVMEASKKDKPLWVCISWMPVTNDRDVYTREIHRSMTRHFNFDYVYNYFFNADKVKGQPYTILNSQEQKNHLAAIKNNKPTTIVTNNTASGFYLFDDFSNNVIGTKPKGWHMPAVGAASTVVQIDGKPGNWVKIGRYPMIPNGLRSPLPNDFKMEFDVACEDFDGAAGSTLLLKISNKTMTTNGDYKDAANPVNIEFDMKAGNAKFTQNPSGYVRLKATYKGMNSQLRYADVLQYSNYFNNKKNLAHITITKKGNKVTATINDQEIISLDKYGKSITGFNEIPANTKFTTFEFSKTTDDRNVFISNVKISSIN